uniref:SAM domain-containing protein n=1 Tax=Esox lucius TaxID=8010 RepID=A0A6Q2XCT8_ESOLU
MMSDASDMLAAALEQMDGIIAGSKAMDYSNGMFDCQSPTSPYMGSLRALNLLEDLRGVLELMDTEEREGLRCQIPDATAGSLVDWLQQGHHMSNGHHMSMGGDLYQERLSRLEGDKESLELLGRTTLETQKLDLMAEVSNLKLKLNSFEKDRHHFDFRDSEDMVLEINELRYRVTEMESERLQYEKKLKSTKEELAVLRRELEDRDGELRRLNQETGFRAITSDVEVQRMKKAVESLMAANEEKDRKIEELRQSLLRYKKVQDMVMSVQGNTGELLSHPKCVQMYYFSTAQGLWCPRVNIYPLCTVWQAACPCLHPNTCGISLWEKSPLNDKVVCSLSLLSSAVHVTAVEEISTISQHPPTSLSLSRPANTEDDSFGNKKARSSFGRGFFKIKGGKRTASTPNLAETEQTTGTDHLDLAGLPQRSANSHSTNTLTSVTSTTSPEGKKKSKGIKALFGKLRRSQSTTFNLDDNLSEPVEFKRGGVRATAGPRLGWSRDLQRLPNNELDAPFARWSKEQVCDWLQEQGLGIYLNMARLWISSGQTLLQASQQDLERELGIKHPLHRKKLQLALQALGSEEEDNKSKLDYNWVTRWLDDIGLPQYKTQFDEGRVDGRMLHYMTVDDLLSLKVGSVLHHLSIKRAIQVLRLNNYEPNCLRRRPSDETKVTCYSTNVVHFSNGLHFHQVLEPRFNVETMALLLNIPPNKTLLRRHLATHFNLLVGSEAQGLKQECLENPDYTLLTATAKIKPRKMSFGSFGNLRKKRQEENEEYVCPMDVEMPKGRSFQKGYELQLYEDDLDQLEQMEDSEGTVRQIGAFSEGIQNLTVIDSAIAECSTSLP